MPQENSAPAVHTEVEKVLQISGADLDDLCYATEEAIKDGIGFNWVHPPSREVLERYWKGVLMVPERTLFTGRLDGTVAASCQLVAPGPNKPSQGFCAMIDAHFVAPWARGHGLAKMLLQAVEEEAAVNGFSAIKLDVIETQDRAIHLYESCGYKRWGILPKYKQVGEDILAGHFFFKELTNVWW